MTRRIDKQSTARPSDRTRHAAQSMGGRVDSSELVRAAARHHGRNAVGSRPRGDPRRGQSLLREDSRERAMKLQPVWDWLIILSSYALVHWGHPYIAVTVALLLIQVQWGSVQ